MSIGVWKTGHEIADTIADALCNLPDSTLYDVNELTPEKIKSHDIHIAYGILRGTTNVFNECSKQGKIWFNVDRGYMKPGHYDGYYRISPKGTQYTSRLAAFLHDEKRFDSLGYKLSPWRGYDKTKPVLICPPTEYIKGFFKNIDGDLWIKRAVSLLNYLGIDNYKIRTKEMSMKSAEPDMLDSNFVLTFNCSLGWKALARGIPCISDVNDSFVGSFFGVTPDDKDRLTSLSNRQEEGRKKMFSAMANLQVTIEEMKDGTLCNLIDRLLSI